LNVVTKNLRGPEKHLKLVQGRAANLAKFVSRASHLGLNSRSPSGRRRGSISRAGFEHQPATGYRFVEVRALWLRPRAPGPDNPLMPATLLRSAALIEGLRLEDALPIGALVVAPVPHEGGFAGQELRQTFNDLMAAHGFVSAFDRAGWAMQLATRHRLAFVATPPIETDQVVPASMEATRTLGRLVDALALTHGGAPRIFAAANEFSPDGGKTWRTLALMAGGGTHPGNVLERLLPDNDRLTAIGPHDIWVHAESTPLVALWLSLYRGVSAERRWDVRVLRACSLLEAIGRERLDRKTLVIDESGNVLLDHSGRQPTTGQLRGLMYMLVGDAVDAVVSSPRVLLTHDTRSLWGEIGIWTDIRNMVGHEGQWLPPALPSTLVEAQQRSAAALELAGRGDGYDAGALRYADAVMAGTETVLRAVVLQNALKTVALDPATGHGSSS
jgi:hypothetical protein